MPLILAEGTKTIEGPSHDGRSADTIVLEEVDLMSDNETLGLGLDLNDKRTNPMKQTEKSNKAIDKHKSSEGLSSKRRKKEVAGDDGDGEEHEDDEFVKEDDEEWTEHSKHDSRSWRQRKGGLHRGAPVPNFIEPVPDTATGKRARTGVENKSTPKGIYLSFFVRIVFVTSHTEFSGRCD